MASLASIRDGLKTNLATISGLRAHDTIPDQINPPAAIIGPPETIEWHKTFGSAKARWVMPVRVYVGRASERAAQDKLDAYLAGSGSSSVKTAIESDTTLSGAADYTVCLSARGYGVYRVGDIDYLGAEWLVEVVG